MKCMFNKLVESLRKAAAFNPDVQAAPSCILSVSYTHLTLPTIYSV